MWVYGGGACVRFRVCLKINQTSVGLRLSQNQFKGLLYGGGAYARFRVCLKINQTSVGLRLSQNQFKGLL